MSIEKSYVEQGLDAADMANRMHDAIQAYEAKLKRLESEHADVQEIIYAKQHIIRHQLSFQRYVNTANIFIGRNVPGAESETLLSGEGLESIE